MTERERARLADAAGNPEAAIRYYESARRSRLTSLSDDLDLVVLYMQCTDFGFASHHRVSRVVEESACTRAIEILEEAATTYPGDTEVEFWRRYIPWIALGDAIDTAAIRELAARGDSLVPYLYLCESPDDEEHARLLLAEVTGVETTRARYVESVLRSSVRRTRP